jgi:hypothetical protein
LAVSTCVELALTLPVSALRDRKTWVSILQEADTAVSAAEGAGFCSLVVLGAEGDGIRGASCGDCAASLCRAGQLVDLTEDQRKNPPVGSRSAQPVGFAESLKTPWRLIVMSDGVWKYAGWEAVAQALKATERPNIVASLRQVACREGRLLDDFSVAIFERP